jgi:hypothetical protein
MTYSEKLKDPRWQKRRLEALEGAGWKCQRCSDSTTQLHVHHKKYKGEPWDVPQDWLQVLCKPCHDGEHFMQERGPLKVYLAGKIGHTDWRHQLFPLRDWWSGDCHDSEEPPKTGPVIEVDGIKVECGGPFFIGCDHGCYHGETRHGQLSAFETGHGVQDGGISAISFQSRMTERARVFGRCVTWLKQSDFLFCYIDGEGAYGTICEVLMWRKHFPKKPCCLSFASAQLLESYWFFWTSLVANWSDYAITADPACYVDDSLQEAFRQAVVDSYKGVRDAQ